MSFILLLAIITIVLSILIYVFTKYILKKDVYYKQIITTLSISAILSVLTSFFIGFLFSIFNYIDQIYRIPFVGFILFLLLSFLLYKTKSKYINSFIAIVLSIILTMSYVFYNKTYNINFRFLINLAPPIKTTKTKVQNKYMILIQNTSTYNQTISFKVLNDDIKIAKPTKNISLQAKERKKLELILESNLKPIKSITIKIEADNGYIKKVRNTIFIYNY